MAEVAVNPPEVDPENLPPCPGPGQFPAGEEEKKDAPKKPAAGDKG